MSPPAALIVVIGTAEVLPALEKRVGNGDAEIVAFSEAEALRALETITRRKPRAVALERVFAATPRGAALINRIKADPSLLQTEIRVVAHDSDYSRVSPRKPPEPVVPIDQRGTRRAPRVKVAEGVGVLIEGAAGTLVDLSAFGAQVLCSTQLKPSQRVRIALGDGHGSLRFNGAVAWASFEIPPKGGPRYRAGVEFVDADGPAVDAFARRHKAT